MPLTPAQLATLGTASSGAINGGAQRALSQIAQQRWITPRNRYRVSTIKSIEADYAAGSLNSRQLTDYVAVSTPLHCCDGWAYLGRAIGCHLHGDPDSARHLAYYAELRATMAILASQGVVILNHQHFVIDSGGSATLLRPGGTHEVAWEALEAWSGLGPTATLLGEILVPGGQSLNQWIAAMPNGASWQPIAKDWLLKLGLDLQLLSSDRNARNEASYRPTRLHPRTSLTSAEAATSAREIWTLLEPAPPLSFGEIDRFLLRLTLETAFEATEGSSPRRSPMRYSNVVSSVVGTSVMGADAFLWEQFLKRETLPDEPGIIDLVRLNRRRTVPPVADREVRRSDHHLSVMARALLLLRIASGATRRMLVDAGISFDDLSFWWHPYGTERGLWEVPPTAAHITDSWADTEADLLDIDDWLSHEPPGTYHDLLSTVPSSLTSLTNLEMVGLWSLAS